MSEQDYKVLNQDKIVSVLNGLQLSKAPLNLVIPDLEDSWQSTVLKVLADAECFYLSTLGVPQIDRRLMDGAIFSLEGRDRGILIKMDTLSVVQSDASSANDVLSVAFPDNLDYIQQRECVRIDIESQQIRLALMHQGVIWDGRVTDISYEGCGAEFIQYAATKMPPSGSIVTLKLEFPETQTGSLETDAVICHLATAPGVTHTGLQFKSLNLRTQNVIDQFVLKQQRNACRSRKMA